MLSSSGVFLPSNNYRGPYCPAVGTITPAHLPFGHSKSRRRLAGQYSHKTSRKHSRRPVRAALFRGSFLFFNFRGLRPAGEVSSTTVAGWPGTFRHHRRWVTREGSFHPYLSDWRSSFLRSIDKSVSFFTNAQKSLTPPIARIGGGWNWGGNGLWKLKTELLDLSYRLLRYKFFSTALWETCFSNRSVGNSNRHTDNINYHFVSGNVRDATVANCSLCDIV